MHANGNQPPRNGNGSPQAGASHGDRSYPVNWTPELLMRLDWKRFQDLVRLVVTRAGFRSRPVLVGQAGVALISVNRWEDDSVEALICCVPWDLSVVPGRLVEGFHQEVINRGYPRGTIFTPGRFRSDALEFEGEREIELVSGEDFLDVLDRLPGRERSNLLELTTAGDFEVPTCPACTLKMELRDSEAPHLDGGGKLKNITIKASETFAGDVRCSKLTIQKGAEAQFMKGVFTKRMVVRGRAVGNFVCEGQAEIAEGAWLIGAVAARKVNLHPGGVLDGEMRILDVEEVEPVIPLEERRLWGCPNYPRCDVVLPLREGDATAPVNGSA